MTCGIYEVWCGPYFYQGSSKNIESRWKRHQRDLKNGKHDNPYFQAAFDKHGWTDSGVLVECEEHTLIAWEQAYLDTNWGDEKFLNLSPVADRPRGRQGIPMSPEARAKLSASRKGKKYGPQSAEAIANRVAAMKASDKYMMNVVKMSAVWVGRKHTDEAKAKNAAAHVGKKHTDETRAKMSAAAKGRVFSDEHRANLSDAHKARHARRRAEAERHEVLALFGMED